MKIHDAAKNGDLKLVKQLLEKKPELATAHDRQGRGLLHFACSAPKPNLNLVKFLLDEGFAIDQAVGKDKCTPLFFAVARSRNPKLVQLLIERGAKVTNAPGHGLFAAGWYDDVKNLDLLIAHGAKVDIVTGVTPFFACCIWKKFKAARFLASKGANVHFRDRKGRTVVDYGIARKFAPAELKQLRALIA